MILSVQLLYAYTVWFHTVGLCMCIPVQEARLYTVLYVHGRMFMLYYSLLGKVYTFYLNLYLSHKIGQLTVELGCVIHLSVCNIQRHDFWDSKTEKTLGQFKAYRFCYGQWKGGPLKPHQLPALPCYRAQHKSHYSSLSPSLSILFPPLKAVILLTSVAE